MAVSLPATATAELPLTLPAMPDPDLRATEHQASSGILDDPPQGPEKFILVTSVYMLTHLPRDGHFPLSGETG